MSEIAREREACDVCAGRVAPVDAIPGTVLCSTHFLATLDDPHQNVTRVCARCGWPAARSVADCDGHPHDPSYTPTSPMRYY